MRLNAAQLGLSLAFDLASETSLAFLSTDEVLSLVLLLFICMMKFNFNSICWIFL